MGDLDVANLPFTSAVCSKTKSYETLMGRAASARGRASGVDDCGPAGEQESELLKIEHSVEALLRRAKLCSKYLKDVVTYVEKRAHLDLEYSKNLAKLAQTIKPLICEEVRKYFNKNLKMIRNLDVIYIRKRVVYYNSLISLRFRLFF
jgi:Fes/CIP4, and EFC/F-BAR homology domain